MLKYMEFGLSRREVPGETSICIFLTGCPNQCANCHYLELQSKDGIPLNPHYRDMLDLYGAYATCVCFMGEGGGSRKDRAELLKYLRIAKERRL